MKKVIVIGLLSLFILSCYDREKKVDKNELLGFDYRLFQDTPAWTLAKAVEDEDITVIKREVMTKGIRPDYREQKYGGTLLMIAIRNDRFKSAKALLELGANPNLGNKYRGTSAMIFASKAKSPKYLKLLLEHKGDPNSIEAAPTKEGDRSRETALIAAISYLNDNSLEKVKLLVEAGADINYVTKGQLKSALSTAMILDRMDVVLYLLQKGANYEKALYIMSNGHKVYILEGLRCCMFDLNSRQHLLKKQIVYFLKSKGLDYYKEPIPERILKKIKERLPDNWKNYIEKY